MIDQQFMLERLIKIEPLIEDKHGFHNIVIPYDPEWSTPFAWYDTRNKRIYIKYTTESSVEESINHEGMHKILDQLVDKEACSKYDSVYSFVQDWLHEQPNRSEVIN